MYVTKISSCYILTYEVILANNFSKILKNFLQLFTGLQFYIYYIIKTAEFKIAEMTRFFNYLSSYSFVPVINLKILENSQECVYSEIVCLKNCYIRSY